MKVASKGVGRSGGGGGDNCVSVRVNCGRSYDASHPTREVYLMFFFSNNCDSRTSILYK
jgi:hypothetical protein